MDVIKRYLHKNCAFLPKFVFWCLGVSVNAHESIIYRVYSVIMITCTCVYPWSNLHVLLHHLDDFDVVANAVFNFIGGISASLRLLIMLYNQNRFNYVFDVLEKLHDTYNTEPWSQSRIYSVNRKLAVGLIAYYIALFSLFLATLVDKYTIKDSSKWRTPISDVSVIDITYSPNYEIAWVYQVLAVTLISSCYCITDILIGTITVDLSTQFKIFRNEITQIFGKNHNSLLKDDGTSGEKQKIFINRIVKKVVTRHLFLIEIVAEVEKITSPMMFLSVTGSLCVLCFTLYYASVLPLFDPKAMQSYLEIFMITCSLFFICYCGTEISFASESIAAACYGADFVGTDLGFQKSLMMVIMRSQKPLALTVGRFANLSLPVFVTIVKNTYTFYMVLSKSNDRAVN